MEILQLTATQFIKPMSTGRNRPMLLLEQQIFYRSLRGGRLDFGPFKEKLGRLTDGQIQGYATAIPAEWRSKDDFSDKLVEYLGEARKHREALIQFIKHLLR